MVGIIISIVLGAVITGFATRGYTLWKTSIETLNAARNALDDNIALLETGLAWEQARGLSIVSARAASLTKLRQQSDELTKMIDDLESELFVLRLFYTREQAQHLYSLYVHWHLKRRESIVGISDIVSTILRQERATRSA